MKFYIQSLSILASALTLLFVSSCSSNSVETSEDDSAVQLTSRKTTKDTLGGNLTIAYYVQDSIAKGFNYYRRVDSMLKAKERVYEKQLRGKYENYQLFREKIQKRLDANEIPVYDLEDLQQEDMRRQEAIATFERQKAAELQKESFEYQSALMSKISEAGREFCQKNDIDMLFFYQKGSQITYISEAFDVTKDFLKFLNKREKEISTAVEDEIEEGIEKESKSGLKL